MQARRPQPLRWALLAILVLAFSSLAAGGAKRQIPSSEAGARGDASALPHGVVPTRAGLQLIFKADCGDVQIFTDAANEVSYGVRLDPGVAAPDATAFLRDFSFTPHQTPRGVVLVARASKQTECRGHLIYEIRVPHRYVLDIAVQSGAIAAQDIEGAVALFTGGGDIRLGGVGSSDSVAKDPMNASFAVRLETAGGDIFVGDIAGGLRASTGGGQISVGNVRGPAVLRTGGGDVRVGHVFGSARFSSGGGNIIARKIDGGLWAETDGGRVEIGDANSLAAFALPFSEGARGVFPAASSHELPADGDSVLAMTDLAEVGGFARRFDAFFWGGIRVDPTEEEKHLVSSVAPAYPEVARLAGIEGDITLRILIGQDGTIRDLRPISGPPVLARAAMRAVEQWRYAPALVDGHPIDVVTTVTFAFRLHQ